MKIAIASDHNGVTVKAQIVAWLVAQGHAVDDRGTHDAEVVDYPPLCAEIGRRVVAGEADRGIVVGGTGGGESIACNKIRGVRAGLCHSVFLAEISRANNDSNVLVVAALVVSPEQAVQITATWLATPFSGGRHQRRLEQIAAIEEEESSRSA